MEMAVCEAALLGGWTLERWSIDWSDGRPTSYPFGEDASGLLLYASGGCMSAGISRKGRSGLGGGNVRHAPESARAAAFDGYFQYQGRFRVLGNVVEHHVTHSLNPDFVGTVQRREALLEDDRLELRAEERTQEGTTRLHRLVWRRAS